MLCKFVLVPIEMQMRSFETETGVINGYHLEMVNNIFMSMMMMMMMMMIMMTRFDHMVEITIDHQLIYLNDQYTRHESYSTEAIIEINDP